MLELFVVYVYKKKNKNQFPFFTKCPVCTNPVQVISSRSKTEARQVQAQTQLFLIFNRQWWRQWRQQPLMAVKRFLYLKRKKKACPLQSPQQKKRKCERAASSWAPPLSICSPSLRQALWRDKSRPPRHSIAMESIDDPLTESPKNLRCRHRRHQQRQAPPPTATTPQLTPPTASRGDGRRPRTSNKVHPKFVEFVAHYALSSCTRGSCGKPAVSQQ